MIARDPEGYAQAEPGHRRSPPGREGEGASGHRPGGSGRSPRWALAGAHRMSQRKRPGCAHLLGTRRRLPRSAHPGGGIRAGERGGGALGPRRPSRHREKRRPRTPCGRRRACRSWRPTTSTTPPPPSDLLPPSSARSVRAGHCTDLDGWTPPAATAHLRSGAEQARRFARWPGAVETAAELGRACAFDLRLVAPGLPDFPVPGGHTEQTWLVGAGTPGRTRPLRPARLRARPWRVGAARPRARRHRRARVRRLLPRRVGHRRVLPA